MTVLLLDAAHYSRYPTKTQYARIFEVTRLPLRKTIAF